MELAACVARSEAAVKNVKRKLGKADVKIYSSLSEILKDESIHVLDLVLPIPVTSSAVAECLAAGRCLCS